MGIDIQPPGPAVTPVPAGSISGYGTITAPAAGGTVAAIVSTPVGTYNVTVLYYLSGTVTAADTDNFKLVANSVTVAHLPCPANAASGDQVLQFSMTIVKATTTIALQALAAGSVAAVYTATIIATQVA